MTKLKKDCTPEEWAQIRAYARVYDAKRRKSPDYQKYTRNYVRTEEYRRKDNSRYCEARRMNQLTNYRKRAYGVPESEVNTLMLLQNGRCGICKRLFSDIEKRGAKQVTQCVDHCHDTGTFRGLLCRICNTVEGFIRNQGLTPSDYFRRMQDYLESPPAQQERLG